MRAIKPSKNLHENVKEGQPDASTFLGEDREPFNDAIKHFDTIHGYKTVKHLDQVPKKMRIWIKLFVVLIVTGIFVSVFLSILR